MPTLISVADAFNAAKRKAAAEAPNFARVNYGDDSVYIYTDQAKTLTAKWLAQNQLHGYFCRASESSGESKVDLKLAPTASGPERSVFNYHVKYQKDTRAEEAAAAQSVADKKAAALHKAKQDEENKKKADAAAAAALKQKEDEKKAKDMQVKANTAWNTFIKTKAFKKGTDEKKWKADWIKNNTR